MSILIKNVLLYNNITDILIEGNKIKTIAPNINVVADKVIDGTEKAAVPGFVNCHTHAAMTVFRGFGDDMELEPWLSDKIWPYEAKLTSEIVYHAMKLACLEMIKTGTTCFNDMYWNLSAGREAAEEMGIRSFQGKVILDSDHTKSFNETVREVESSFNKYQNTELTTFTLAPHAVYTVSTRILEWLRDFSKANDLLVHMHLAETPLECDNCKKQYGVTPVRYLNRIGLLSPRLIIAHCLWLDDEEMQMLADNDVKIVHNPNSNLKLASGYHFKYHEMKDKGLTVGLGTDGVSSSNNLDMTETMKVASFIGKAWRDDPTACSAVDMFKCATHNGGIILNKQLGDIKEGYLADIVLFDLHTPAFTPNYNLISNIVYSGNGNDVDTVICNGKVLMENRKVENEDEILRNGNIYAHKLVDDDAAE